MTVRKKVLIIIGVLLILVTGGVIAMFMELNSATSAYNDFDFGKLDLSSIDDGTYIGSEDGGIVKASVEVTIKNNLIEQVKILSHDCGTGQPAEAIVKEIAETDSLTVDTVSGATYSSNVIKMAVFYALSK